MYFYQGIQDNFERVIPGYKGFEGTSVIMPGTFLGGIFEKLMLGLKKNGGKVGGKDYSGKIAKVEEYAKIVKEIFETRDSAKEEKQSVEVVNEKDGKEDEIREPAVETEE